MLSRRLARSIPSSARGYATKVQATDFEAGKVSSLTVKVNAGSRYADLVLLIYYQDSTFKTLDPNLL